MRRRSLLTSLCLIPAIHAAEKPTRKLESMLMLPEPRVLRSPLSLTPENARHTVLTPARETEKGGIEAYPAAEFAKLGIGSETFAKHAAKAADKRLATLKPDILRDDKGRVTYAVYRGEQPLYASLFIAPSLPKIFEPMFGKELWVALPDRHSLYIFPAHSAALQDFSADLAERFAAEAFAASPEIFSLIAGQPPKVIGSFAGSDE